MPKTKPLTIKKAALKPFVPSQQAIEEAVTPERKKAPITAFFDEEVRYELRGIAHQNRTTIQQMMEDWLREVFAKNGRRWPEMKR
jgi:hypothetical protein